MLNVLFLLLARITPSLTGSGTSFKEIYEAHFGLVHFIVKKFDLPPQEVEDIVQDVFLKFLQVQGDIEPGRAAAYLTTMARNKAVDALRSRKSRKTDPAGDTVLDDSENLWRNDPRRIMEAQAVGAFLEDMKNEPAGEILILYYQEGLSIREIAEKRSESLGNISSKLARARARFKERLKSRLDALDSEEYPS